jgi:hypothetical protein
MVILSTLIFLVYALEKDCANPKGKNKELVSSHNLTIGTFNTMWLFDGVNDELSPWKNTTQAEAHTKLIAQQIYQLNVDVLNLVEVESCSILSRLMSEMERIAKSKKKKAPKYQIYLKNGKDTVTRQNVAMLSKFVPVSPGLAFNDSRISYPIDGSKCGYAMKNSTGVSKHYYTWLNFPIGKHGLNLTVLLVGVHLKANPNDPASCAQREAQAIIIRDTIRAALLQAKLTPAQANIVVMGDLNDYDEKTSDVSKNIPLSKTLQVLKDREYLNLINVMEYVPADKRYTHWWDKNKNLEINYGELSALDHMLVSEHLMKYVTDIQIHNSDLYPHGNLKISDHWPITLTISLDKMRSDMDKPPIFRFTWLPFILFSGILVAVILLVIAIAVIVVIVKKIKARLAILNQDKHQLFVDEDIELDQVEVNNEPKVELGNEEQTAAAAAAADSNMNRV